ncbi:MAG: histidine kinase [Eubacterium sp.]|nr:histidine kinase [Eubacterium sp.]
MLRILQTLHSSSFKAKLLFSYVLLITIPLTISSLLVYQQFRIYLSENSTTMISQRLNQETNNINQTLTSIENIGFQLSSDSFLTAYLNEQHVPLNNDSYITMTNKISPMLKWFKNTNRNISKINIITLNDSISEIDSFVHSSGFEYEAWFMEVKKNTSLGLPYWEKYHEQRAYRKVDTLNPATTPIFSLFCIINPVYKTSASYLELEVNPKLLFGSLNVSPVGKSGYLAVLDGSGNIISGKNTPLLKSLIENKDLNKLLKTSKGEYTYTFDGNDYFIKFQEIKKLGVYVASIVSTAEIEELFDSSKRSYIITIIVTFILLLVLAYYLGYFMTKKIKKLSTAFISFQGGNFNTRIEVNGSDELDKLSSDFNNMAFNIQDLINKVYKAEIAQRKSELSALQSQIKPHFIFNTLESLKMTAELHDEEEISDGLTALGNLIRQNIHTGNHLISVESELENLADYIKIQNLIRNNTIKVEFIIQDEIRQAAILNLVLQPLVENCIIHGFRSNQEFLEISICGKLVEDSIIFTISDNGKGIDLRQLQILNRNLENSLNDSNNSSTGTGIGLMNVNRRIKLYFGDEFGICIESNCNEGTTITVNIPFSL